MCLPSTSFLAVPQWRRKLRSPRALRKASLFTGATDVPSVHGFVSQCDAIGTVPYG